MPSGRCSILPDSALLLRVIPQHTECRYMLTVILDQTQYGIESAHTRIVGVARTKQSGQFQESFSQTGILGTPGSNCVPFMTSVIPE